MKKCHACGEEVQDEALKCRYCGTLLVNEFWLDFSRRYQRMSSTARREAWASLSSEQQDFFTRLTKLLWQSADGTGAQPPTSGGTPVPSTAATPLDPKVAKRRRRVSLGCLVAFVALLTTCYFCARADHELEHSIQSLSAPTSGGGGSVSVGEVGQLRRGSSRSILVAVDESALARLTQLAVAGDERGMATLALEGRAFLVPQGTRVRVINSGFGKREVRIEDGPMAGRSGWVDTEFVVR